MLAHTRMHYTSLLMLVWLAGCTGGGVRLEPLSAPRAVVAYRTTGGELVVRHSADGAVWTEAMNVKDSNDATMRVAGAPTVVHEGGLYHLYWVTPTGELRYATSRAADAWAVQSSALTTLPSTIAVARGGGHHVALVRASNPSAITAVDLDAPTTARVQVAATSVAVPTIAFGAGRFVAAVIGGDRRVRIVASTDGRQWADLTTLGVVGAFEATLHFSDGAFQLATQESSSSSTIPVVRCRRFASADGSSWAESPTPACGNSSTSVSTARLNGSDLYLVNFDNRYLRASIAGAALQDTHVLQVDGRPSIAIGPGPRLAALRLDRVTIEGDGGQDVSIAAIGLKVRIGAEESARATYSGQLVEFATDLDTGEQAQIPAIVSPTGWLIKATTAQQLTQPGAQVDLVGAIVIGIERGDCPEGPIRAKLHEARSAIEASLNRNLATADVLALQDASRRDAIVGRVQCEVLKSIAGEDPATCSSAPPVPSSGFLDAVGKILSVVPNTVGDFFVSLACAFNRDEQLAPAEVLGVASTFFPEGNPPRSIYSLAEGVPLEPLDPFSLRSEQSNDLVWRVDGHWSYLTE
jgi:hypothetical protein